MASEARTQAPGVYEPESMPCARQMLCRRRRPEAVLRKTGTEAPRVGATLPRLRSRYQRQTRSVETEDILLLFERKSSHRFLVEDRTNARQVSLRVRSVDCSGDYKHLQNGLRVYLQSG